MFLLYMYAEYSPMLRVVLMLRVALNHHEPAHDPPCRSRPWAHQGEDIRVYSTSIYIFR